MKISTDYRKWYVDGIESFENKKTKRHTGDTADKKGPKPNNNNGSDKPFIRADFVPKAPKSNKKPTKIIVWILVGILVAAILTFGVLMLKTYVFDSSDYDDSYDYNTQYDDIENSYNTDEQTDESMTAEPTRFTGKCGDNAEYTISKNSDETWSLYISGSGELWNPENIDWQIDDGLIEKVTINVAEIQPDQFISSPFTSVKSVHLNSAVKHIGAAAFSIDSLEEISVDNDECQIDYISGDNIFGTLGYSSSNVIKIHCYKDSTTDQYASDWNANYPGTYEIDYY